MSKVFTFIMEYRGGTYISQVQSDSIINACRYWAGNLEVANIKYLGNKSKEKIVRYLLSDELSLNPLDGLKNVWFMGIPVNGYLFINIVETTSD